MAKPTGQVFSFSGPDAHAQGQEFMARIVGKDGVASFHRSGNHIKVNFKPDKDPTARLTAIWSAVKQWKPK